MLSRNFVKFLKFRENIIFVSAEKSIELGGQFYYLPILYES